MCVCVCVCARVSYAADVSIRLQVYEYWVCGVERGNSGLSQGGLDGTSAYWSICVLSNVNCLMPLFI